MTIPPSELCAPQCPVPRPLVGPELFAWMALRRACTGRVARFEGCYYDSGRRVPCFLPDVFDELIESGLLTLTEPDPGSAGWCRVALTSTGHARFAALSEQEKQWARRPLHAEYQRPAAVDAPPVPPAVHGRSL